VISRVWFHEIAEQELNDAAGYYEAQSSGLGLAFLAEVEYSMDRILEHPEAAPFVNQVVRKMLIRRFPYSVMYSVQPEGIHILAIAHQKRRPMYWRGRR
jgi:plasmid stabilization system protein ParE